MYSYIARTYMYPPNWCSRRFPLSLPLLIRLINHSWNHLSSLGSIQLNCGTSDSRISIFSFLFFPFFLLHVWNNVQIAAEIAGSIGILGMRFKQLFHNGVWMFTWFVRQPYCIENLIWFMSFTSVHCNVFNPMSGTVMLKLPAEGRIWLQFLTAQSHHILLIFPCAIIILQVHSQTLPEQSTVRYVSREHFKV